MTPIPPPPSRLISRNSPRRCKRARGLEEPGTLELRDADADRVGVLGVLRAQVLQRALVLLEPGHQLGHLGADRHALQRDDVQLAALLRPVEVGEAEAVALGLARAREAGNTVSRSSGSSTTMSLPSE